MSAERVQSDIDLPGTPPGLDVGARPSPQQLEEALAGIKSAGALFPGNALVYQVGAKQVCAVSGIIVTCCSTKHRQFDL